MLVLLLGMLFSPLQVEMVFNKGCLRAGIQVKLAFDPLWLSFSYTREGYGSL